MGIGAIPSVIMKSHEPKDLPYVATAGLISGQIGEARSNSRVLGTYNVSSELITQGFLKERVTPIEEIPREILNPNYRPSTFLNIRI